MNVVLFFEGTGQGVSGRTTNVTRLYESCTTTTHQYLHLEAGPGTHTGIHLAGHLVGADWKLIFRSARRWFEAHYERLPADGVETRVFLFGFSRGATLARHFAEWLDKLGVAVIFLGLWDTVDATVGLDVARQCPANVVAARHAVARDERRLFFDFVPLDGPQVDEQVFPGCHSDVGGLYEDNHVMADVALAWIQQGARKQGLRVKSDSRVRQAFDPATVVLHDSRRLISNLWGVLGTKCRNLEGLKAHRACRYLLP